MTEGRPERFSRGGCWSRPRSGVRIARRIVEDPEDRFESRGIRLVEVVDDEPAPSSSPDRVYRGGCWSEDARVALRGSVVSGLRGGNLGVRLVEVIDDPAPKSAHPHIPRSHRFVRGGSWRFLGSKNDRKRVYPRFHTSENVGIRLVEVINDEQVSST